MARERPIAVSRETIQKTSGDCGIALVGSSAMRGMSESRALMAEVSRGPMRKHHQSSDRARLILEGLGYLRIFFC